mmetsp:Transcript_4517/g.14380  ORF Transcript_4517/g.14380 Transcript_4517/m.14380 type:complete len:211 (-) Transcript_4517:299-931(-)
MCHGHSRRRTRTVRGASATPRSGRGDMGRARGSAQQRRRGRRARRRASRRKLLWWRHLFIEPVVRGNRVRGCAADYSAKHDDNAVWRERVHDSSCLHLDNRLANSCPAIAPSKHDHHRSASEAYLRSSRQRLRASVADGYQTRTRPTSCTQCYTPAVFAYTVARAAATRARRGGRGCGSGVGATGGSLRCRHRRSDCSHRHCPLWAHGCG